jgi:hypothetical protein
VSQDRTLSRIGALLRQAEGTDNEHEADAFLQAAQRLATAASIDLAVARAHTSQRERRTEPTQRSVSIGEPGTRGLRTYVELFLAISHANDIKCDIAQNSSTVYCYGFESDVAACQALYASLAVQMVRASDAYLKSGAYRTEIVGRYVTGRDGYRRWSERPAHATTARINFQQAFARRIAVRLQEARSAAREQAIADEVHLPPSRTEAGSAPSTALVLRNKEVELRDFYRQHSKARGTWKGARASAGESSQARRAGDRAARAARLGNAPAIGGSRRAIDGGVGL